MTVTPFPGSVSARNALTSRTATDEQRAAARELGRRFAPEDLMWAAPGDPVRSTRLATDEELREAMPSIARKADRLPRLAPDEPAMETGWMALRGWEIPALKLIEHEVQGIPIPQRASDGFISATAMCRAAGKRWSDYWRLPTSKEFVDELSSVVHIHTTELVTVEVRQALALRSAELRRK